MSDADKRYWWKDLFRRDVVAGHVVNALVSLAVTSGVGLVVAVSWAAWEAWRGSERWAQRMVGAALTSAVFMLCMAVTLAFLRRRLLNERRTATQPSPAIPHNQVVPDLIVGPTDYQTTNSAPAKKSTVIELSREEERIRVVLRELSTEALQELSQLLVDGPKQLPVSMGIIELSNSRLIETIGPGTHMLESVYKLNPAAKDAVSEYVRLNAKGQK